LNCNRMMQTGGALATYLALMGAFLAGYSPLEYALLSAVLLSLWLSLYSIASSATSDKRVKPATNKVIPSLSESMAELHALQTEINTLQAQFSARTPLRPTAPDDLDD